ncbi:hypothetical protein K435DRAFT_851744 [Dendrothele bispora CBS 962.96]|uniref:Uncharacterized protein n=1 Tax=Dendrothele bispora (strain CBS 962.96) TaxID=1314807 RepID=A0A4S8ML96_DENBC|nr:hypothetical protein K435DRAFT_851744 [Dendrothele bispora CBS 962.96]
MSDSSFEPFHIAYLCSLARAQQPNHTDMATDSEWPGQRYTADSTLDEIDFFLSGSGSSTAQAMKEGPDAAKVKDPSEMEAWNKTYQLSVWELKCIFDSLNKEVEKQWMSRCSDLVDANRFCREELKRLKEANGELTNTRADMALQMVTDHINVSRFKELLQSAGERIVQSARKNLEQAEEHADYLLELGEAECCGTCPSTPTARKPVERYIGMTPTP